MKLKELFNEARRIEQEPPHFRRTTEAQRFTIDHVDKIAEDAHSDVRRLLKHFAKTSPDKFTNEALMTTHGSVMFRGIEVALPGWNEYTASVFLGQENTGCLPVVWINKNFANMGVRVTVENRTKAISIFPVLVDQYEIQLTEDSSFSGIHALFYHRDQDAVVALDPIRRDDFKKIQTLTRIIGAVTHLVDRDTRRLS